MDEAPKSSHLFHGESRLAVFVDTGYQEGVVTLPSELPHHPLDHEVLTFREAGLIHDRPNSQQGQSPTPLTALSKAGRRGRSSARDCRIGFTFSTLRCTCI